MAAEGTPAMRSTVPSVMLQWGRGRMAAKGVLLAGDVLVHDIASMGPRPDGRGRAGIYDRPAAAM